MKIEEILFKEFKLPSFRVGQKEIISDLLKQENVLAMLPTGSGKSLCYQLPALMLDGITIVVSPLLSLMEDQVQQLKSQGHKAVVALNSFLTKAERKLVIESLHQFKIIYASPEILQQPLVLSRLKKCNVSIFVVDEAHCISQWGHEFRMDYLKLSDVREKLGNPPCLAITATATPEVQQDIVHHLKLQHCKKHIYSIDRPNISLIVKEQASSTSEKVQELLRLVNSLKGPGIIYAATRKWTEDLVAMIKKSGIKEVAYYHGGMNNEDRLLIQQQFLQDDLQIICCTSAFGMGINKQNIRYIIHFHFPLQLEAYLQEIGRAGRDGKESVALTLMSEDEHMLQNSLLLSEFPDDKQLSRVSEFLQTKTTSDEILSDPVVMAATEVSEVMWRFLRFHLETLGVIVNNKVNKESDLNKVMKQISRHIANRIEQKQGNFLQFLKWLNTKDRCRREMIMERFHEIISVKPINCCNFCGVKLESYIGKHQQMKDLNARVNSWETELKRIFFTKTTEVE